MQTKTLTNGLMVAAVAAIGMMPLAAPASAASLKLFFGPTTSHSMMHNGRQAMQVCRTQYRWVTRNNKTFKVAVGNDCHWTFAKQYPRASKPGVQLRLF